MFAYLDRGLVVFDIEYTDSSMEPLSLRVPDICEIGGYLLSSDLTVIDQFSSLVQPNNLDDWTEDSYRLTGITRADLENAETWDKVGLQWAKFAKYNHTRLMSWHAYFDVPILKAAYRRAKLGYPHIGFCVDVASLAYGLFSLWGVQTKGWGLNAVCNRLHVSVSEGRKHRALGDAELVVKILGALMEFEDTFLGGGMDGVGSM